MYSTETSQQSQLHTQANAFPSLPEHNEIWIKVSYTRSTSPNNDNVTKVKRSKEGKYWLNQLATYSCFAVLHEESEGQQRTSHSSTPKPPPFYVTGVQNNSPLIQLLEQYEIKAFADNF
jgi:hypothetical protein